MYYSAMASIRPSGTLVRSSNYSISSPIDTAIPIVSTLVMQRNAILVVTGPGYAGSTGESFLHLRLRAGSTVWSGTGAAIWSGAWSTRKVGIASYWSKVSSTGGEVVVGYLFKVTGVRTRKVLITMGTAGVE